jgi:hypothetical protein
VTSASTGPIFVLGMLPRSGTNHLWDLVGLHPDVELMHPVYEDHLVRWSHHLVHYVDDVSRHWSAEWDVPADERATLLASIGSGIASWVNGASDRRVVTKMPRVEQAHRFFELFPDAALLVLVRDGRSLSESMTKTFGWTYERSFREWAKSADVVLDLLRTKAATDHLELVRYEDLVTDPGATMQAICTTVGLPAQRYPFDRIDHVPVRGSSSLHGQGPVHWAPVEKTADFAPLERWNDWSAHLHRRFEAIAGDQQRALGYDLHPVSGRSSVAESLGSARDYLVDYRRKELRRTGGRVGRAALRAIKAG